MVKVELSPNDGLIVELEGTQEAFKITFGRARVTVTAAGRDDKHRAGVLFAKRLASKEQEQEPSSAEMQREPEDVAGGEIDGA